MDTDAIPEILRTFHENTTKLLGAVRVYFNSLEISEKVWNSCDAIALLVKLSRRISQRFNMSQKIQNPSHKHILTYTDEESVYRVYICNVCREKGEGGRYRCHPCKFDAHPSCARWPIQKIQNPSHEHFLSYTHVERAFRCDVCRQLGEGGRYRCHPCNFDAHSSCATEPQRSNFNMSQKMQNPSHEHILTYVHIEGLYICDVCREYGKGGRYRCDPCVFDAHPSCARWPIQKIQNPSHEHILTYTHIEEFGYKCNVCRENGKGGRYRCHRCNFDAHPSCARQPQRSKFNMPQKMHNPSHEHILTYEHILNCTFTEVEGRYRCDVCQELGKGGKYRCHPCDFDAHPSCASWPVQKIQNPSHEHFLSYTHAERAFRCDVCRQLGEGGRYRCHPCNFDAHPSCARSAIQNGSNDSQQRQSTLVKDAS